MSKDSGTSDSGTNDSGTTDDGGTTNDGSPTDSGVSDGSSNKDGGLICPPCNFNDTCCMNAMSKNYGTCQPKMCMACCM